MNYQKKAKEYQKVSLETASPGQIILMLFDGALRFIDGAIVAFDIKTKREKNEKMNYNIQRAVYIIAELRSSLNHEVGGEFSKKMEGLYEYMEIKLFEANLRKDVDKLNEVKRHLVEVRNAWAQMLLNLMQQSGDANVIGVSCSA